MEPWLNADGRAIGPLPLKAALPRRVGARCRLEWSRASRGYGAAERRPPIVRRGNPVDSRPRCAIQHREAMVPNAPSQTAEAVCLMRAMEQRRPAGERILGDPYAKLFLNRLARAALASWEASGALGAAAARLSPGLAAYIVTRHRFIDDCLRRALARSVEQLVLLGAGYDSRAYRFAGALKGRPVFEVDFPATSRRKARIVARAGGQLPSADVRAVEIDFATDSLEQRLREAGFRARRPCFFVWEGVSMYLTRDAVKAT